MARIVNFADGAQSETTPTIGNIVASNLVKYVDDAAYEAAELGAPATGNIYYNTTDNTIRYYNGSIWQELIDEQSIQAVENKVIDADNNTITNIDNNEIKTLAGIDATKIADGSVSNTEFQYIDGLTSNAQTQISSKIPNSEKGSANGVATLDSSGYVPSSQIPPIALTSVSVVADNTARDALTIEEGDVAMTTDTGKWWIYDGASWLEVTTPAAVTSVNSQTGAVDLSLDDLTGVNVPTPNNDDILTYTGAQWESVAPFIPDATVENFTTTGTIDNTTDIVFADSSSGAYTLTLPTGALGKILTIQKTTSDFNAITLGAVTAIHTEGEKATLIYDGSTWVVLDRRVPSSWISFTPTGFFTTNVIYTGVMRRIGDSAEFNIRLNFTGATNAGVFYVNLPFSLAIETSKITSTAAGNYTLGIGQVGIGGSGSVTGRAIYDTTTRVGMVWLRDFTSIQYFVGYTSTAPVVISNTDYANIQFTVPIVGWNS